jgi:hypothetical protein
VARCDVGLIPYDDSREYYNIAYPTKLSSYIVAGIPFLCDRNPRSQEYRFAKYPGSRHLPANSFAGANMLIGQERHDNIQDAEDPERSSDPAGILPGTPYSTSLKMQSRYLE